MTLGLVVFAATYLLISVQRLPFVHLNRPAASLLGAVAMVVLGVLPLSDAYAAIDFDVLVFLLGLMLIVGYLEVGKFFEWAAEWILRRAGTPERLLLGVVVGGGLLSALFVNDTVCLVVTPVLLAAIGPLRVKPTPYLIGLAMGANVGSVLSVTGNPQNMLVGIWSGASFGGFLAHMLPVGGGGLAITHLYLRWAYRAELREPFRERLETVPVALDRPLVVKGLTLFGVAVVAWLAGGSLPLVAITAGAAQGRAHRVRGVCANRGAGDAADARVGDRRAGCDGLTCRLAEAPDPLLGNHHVVEPDAARDRVRDIVLRPEGIELQIHGGPELDIGRARCGRRVIALRAVGARRTEVVLHPIPDPHGIGEALDQDVVVPHFEYRPRVRCHVGIEFGVNLEARPRVVGCGERGPADERVAPVGAAAARAGMHLHPVIVEIENGIGTAAAPHRLDREGDPVVSERSDARLRVRPVAGRVVAAEPHARVVPGRAGLVLGVPAHVQLVLPGVEALVEVRGLRGCVAAVRGELHRRRPTTP